MKINTLNRFFSILIFLINIYFLPFTIIQIATTGGTMGLGLLAIPFTFIINLLLVTAYLAFKNKNKNSFLLLFINLFGFTFSFLLFLLLITTPKMD